MGLEALVRGWVSRAQPQALPDNDRGVLRLARYGEGYMVPLIRKQAALADEGSYFVAVSATPQTAITSAIGAASGFDATKPSLVIDNTDSPTNTNAKRIHLDYVYLAQGSTAFSNATSNTALYFAWMIDRINRWSSGGTSLVATNPNADVAKSNSVALVNYGALTVAAASASARTVVPNRLMRLPVTVTALTLANADQFKMNFGGVEPSFAGPVQASATLEATAVDKSFSLPPIIIGPGQSALLYIFALSAGTNVAGTVFPEIGWWER